VNPAIGVPDEVLGFFAYHYAATNMAVSFAKPEYALLDLNFPEGYSDDVIKRVLKDFAEECEKYGTKLVGGHTARYRGLEWPLASTTIIGKRIRRKESPENGDAILLVGEVGAETAWLMGKPIDPKTLTPLPAALRLINAPEVKLMHDVSEGGVYGALEDVAQAYSATINVRSPEVPICIDFPRELDPLTSPSYGAIIVVTSRPTQLIDYCKANGLKCKEIGKVASLDKPHVLIDGKVYRPQPILRVETLYSPQTREAEEAKLRLAAESLAKILYEENLVPEVGTNIAYMPRVTDNPEEVLALDGRIIKTKSGPRICGKPSYGGSTYLANLLITARKAGMPYKAVINIRYSDEFVQKLTKAGVRVYDASSFQGPCPATEAIKAGYKAQAYFYRSKPNLEPSLVILGNDPLKLVALLKKITEQN
jgi:hydrogenase maturation factor/predicted fused transcriptional regulator/phosphomethylpyrimidine kinase